jgi:hypothetical protein
MFMVCALALVLHTDKGVEQGGSVLEKFSKPAPKPTPVMPVKPQTTLPQTAPPQSSTPQSAPNTAPAPTTQPPAKQQSPAPAQQPKKP